MTNKRLDLDAYPTNFKISVAERVRAAMGLPAHMRRKRRIEDLEEATIQALTQILEESEVEFGVGSNAAEEAFCSRAREIDLRLLNDLIDRHNRYFPIEANLPIDLQTGKPLFGSNPWEPLLPLTHEHFIERVRELRRS